MIAKLHLTRSYSVVALLSAGYILVALFFASLNPVLLKGDVLDYWNDSLHWQAPFHPFHVPGYPLAIAAVRGLTFGAVPPVALMMAINAVALVASIVLVYRILQANGASDGLAAAGSFVFALWPFVGLTFTIYPLADVPAICLLLLGLDALERSRRMRAALVFGLAIITHKVMLPAVLLVLLAESVRRKEFFSAKNLLSAGICLAPLTILWFLGALYHHSITWIISANVANEMSPHSTLIVCDGLIGTLISGGARGGVKGAVLLGMAAASLVSLYASLRLRNEYRYWGTALSVVVIMLFVILNQHEIWAAARFSRILVIPLALGVHARLAIKQARPWASRAVATLVLFLLLSQFAFAWYMVRAYSSVRGDPSGSISANVGDAGARHRQMPEG